MFLPGNDAIPTRISFILTIIVQWLQVGLLLWLTAITRPLLAQFGDSLPLPTIYALILTAAPLLIGAGLTTTLVLLVCEARINGQSQRFLLQITNLVLWGVFTTFVVFAYQLAYLPPCAEIQ